MRGLFGAAGPSRHCGPAAPVTCGRPAPQLHRWTAPLRFVLLIAALCLCGPAVAGTLGSDSRNVGLRDLGSLGGRIANAEAVSADGTVVVGDILYAPLFRRPYYRAFRWSARTGAQTLRDPAGQGTHAVAVSADGSVVAGWISILEPKAVAGTRVFRWTVAGGLQDLGTFGGASAIAAGISADGTVIAGTIRFSQDAKGAAVSHAFRWTVSGGVQDLAEAYSQDSTAEAISADGSTIVGRIGLPFSGRPFRWTASAGMQHLGVVGGTGAEARRVSADGSVIAGSIHKEQDGVLRGYIFRWTAADGVQDLSALGEAHAQGLSVDGTVMVGTYAIRPEDPNVRWYLQPVHGFRWTERDGLEDIGTSDGRTPLRPSAESADGSVIVGDYGAGLGLPPNGIFVLTRQRR